MAVALPMLCNSSITFVVGLCLGLCLDSALDSATAIEEKKLPLKFVSMEKYL